MAGRRRGCDQRGDLAARGDAVYQDVNFGGARIILTATGYAYCDLGDFNFNNKASSMINNMSHKVILSQFVNCGGGDTYPAQPESVDSTFENNNFNDKASVVIIQ